MSAKASERESAIAAADSTCPRCGAARLPDQRYCLDCGLALPHVSGRLPALRRRWIRRFGWYPGDWIWISLLTLVVAAAGAAVSIVLTTERTANAGQVFTATTSGPVTAPAPVVPATTSSTVDTSTLPTAPEPTTTAPAKPPVRNGRASWPAHSNGWTIVLVSYPKVNGHPSALQTAAKAASSGLHQVGVLDSSLYASLQPGYFVVFAGIYSSKADADAGVSTARQAGFGGAYSRQIAR
jgi:hypothetical protein